MLTDPILEPTAPPNPDDGNFNFVAIDFVFGTIGGFALIITIGVIIMLKRQRNKKTPQYIDNDIEMNSMRNRSVLLNRYDSVSAQK